ncbi:MAG: hypothetical protein ACLTX6_02600 [Lachnospiraceae bacterium]
MICSFIAGLIYSIWSGNRHGIVQFVLGTAVPIVLLGWLFYFRMLGTGDIKLFCVLGGLMGPYHILWCMWYAVLAGAVLSLAILFFCGGFHQRFHYLEQYIRHLSKLANRVRITGQELLLKTFILRFRSL